MLSEHKLEVLRAVEASELPVLEVLDQLEIPGSTYYRWRHHFRRRRLAGLRDLPPGSRRVWNQILPQERDRILETALLFPEWSPREVSCQVTDRCGFTVSESSVYRILKAEGLIREVQPLSFPAESEYRIKTTRINQQWQTDATYLLVKNWGCQFTSEEHQGFLKDHHIICGMSATGSCADNAPAESFFALPKRESVNRHQYRTRSEARADSFDSIERFFNPRRRRQLKVIQQKDLLLTQPSVKSGYTPP